MPFPAERPRRLRRTPAIRAMVRETLLSPRDFMLPMFAIPGKDAREPIASMPGVERLSPDLIVAAAKEAWAAGVPSVILFGIPPRKDKDGYGTSGWDPEGPVALSVRALKEALPDLVVVTDVCMCEYTDHG